jgi:hypothetical protein
MLQFIALPLTGVIITLVSVLHFLLLKHMMSHHFQKEVNLALIYKKLTELEHRYLILKKDGKLQRRNKVNEYFMGISYLINEYSEERESKAQSVEVGPIPLKNVKSLQPFYDQLSRSPKDVIELFYDFADVLKEIYKIRKPILSALLNLKKILLVRIMGIFVITLKTWEGLAKILGNSDNAHNIPPVGYTKKSL